MNLLRLCALALIAEISNGYLNTSPFFMFSTSEHLISSSNLQTANSINSDISQTLSRCPSDLYILIAQPGVTSEDYTSRKSSPALARGVSSTSSPENHQIRSSVSIPDVLGSLDSGSWINILKSKCGVEITDIDAQIDYSIPTTFDKYPRLLNVDFPPPSVLNRAQGLSYNDAFFASIMDLIPSSKNYTVLYTTSPSRWSTGPTSSPGDKSEFEEYEMDLTIQEEAMHMELKRGLPKLGKKTAIRRRQFEGRAENITLPDGGLFERYQFFTPGIFMVLITVFFLMSILYVGVSALTSLQVTYGAFDKENGQLAGKKQQ